MKVFYIIGGLVVFFLLIQSFQVISKGLKTENQKYRTVQQDGLMEIRFYPSATFATVYSAETDYKSLASSGFRRLAGYIFGGNDQSKSIPMTAPVRMEMGAKGSSMSFVMPESYSETNLPKPKDAKIQIQKSDPQYVAVIAFSGYASDEKIVENRDLLLKLIREKGIQVTGSFSFLGYNAPYQFWGRKNEVVIPIAWKEE